MTAYPFTPFGMNTMDLYGCDSFYAAPMMGMMNPMIRMMMSGYNPAAYDAMKNGINPMGSYFFKKPEQFMTYNVQQNSIKNGIRQLVDYAISDNQDDFHTAYQNLLTNEYNRLKTLMPNMDETTLRKHAQASINTAFQNANRGMSIQKTLKDNGDSPFWQGCKDVFSLGLLGDKKTVTDNIALIEGLDTNGPQRKREKNIQGIGRAVAGIGATLAAVGGLIIAPGITLGALAIAGVAIGLGKICKPD